METVEKAWLHHSSPTESRHSALWPKCGQIVKECNPNQPGKPQYKVKLCRGIIDEVVREVLRENNEYQGRFCHTQAKAEDRGDWNIGGRKRILYEKETQPSIQARKKRKKEASMNMAELGTKIKTWLGFKNSPEEINTKPT